MCTNEEVKSESKSLAAYHKPRSFFVLFSIDAIKRSECKEDLGGYNLIC